ncbi:MAG TPA: alpha-1,4-glucan--maltose-1-phosphate maltosyltransferase [Steroidobacteraceae bacterium]
MSSPQVRVVIENITPRIDCGRFPIKRTIGESVVVEADVFTDGHDQVAAVMMYRHDRATEWHRIPLKPIGNDRFRAEFTVQQLGSYQYSVSAWVDHLESWRRGILKKYEARQDIHVELRTGALIAEGMAERAHGTDAQRLREWAAAIVDTRRDMEARIALTQAESIRELVFLYPDPDIVLNWDSPLEVTVDRERARFSTWYELFPRSAATEPGKHGTFADVEKLLPYVASMGFDVLYMPPIHPIGVTERKGPNNNPKAAPGDPGSPWAIGGAEGGHKAIHPELGTLDDFKRLVANAGEHGIEIALDIAFQTTPDHPYVREHPEWFLKRPDGTIQYAENPPKRYQDIYPFHFESEAGQALANELRSVVEYWISQGIRIFRVDNPHTKPFPFWEGLIGEIRRLRPDVIFLAEAFTRPKVMYRLAKLGFTQSYNYFPWRNTKHELIEYFTELSQPPVSDFFRANLWPNTPDILPEYLQYGGRPGFMIRLVLAATLGASYGIYGPPFELMDGRPIEAGKEEYYDSEKYQIRHWNREDPASLREFIALVNRIRRENAPLQSDRGLKFHGTDNDNLLAYSKTRGGGDSVLVAVNVDPHHAQSGWLQLDLATLGLPETGTYQVHDLLSGQRFLWQGPRNFVSLDPARGPAHIFRIRQRVRSERDFDYFL